MRKAAMAACAALMMVAGCAHEATIIPLQDSNYQAIGQASTQLKAQNMALEGAHTTCDNRKMHEVVNRTESKYTGSVSESTDKIVQDINAFVPIPIPGVNSDTDYHYTVDFVCVPN